MLHNHEGELSNQNHTKRTSTHTHTQSREAGKRQRGREGEKDYKDLLKRTENNGSGSCFRLELIQ